MNRAQIARWILGLGAACSAAAQPLTAANNKPECKPKDIVCRHIVATRQTLADYQKAIRKQISTTQKAYAKIAQAAEQGRSDEIDITLRNQRNRQSETMTDAFIHRARPVFQWKDLLLEYAAQDFEMRREILEIESTDGARFLEGVKSLE